MYYDITYKRKSDTINKKWEILSDKELDEAMKQLRNLASSFNGDVILGIDDLDFIEIKERNYAYYADGKYYFKEEGVNPNNNELVNGYTYIDDSILTGEVEMDDIYKEEIVTNLILAKYDIKGELYKHKGKVILKYNSPKDSILYIDGYENTLEDGSKGLELFRLIFTAKEFYKKDKFIYNDLKKVYNECGIEFTKLKFVDLSQTEINSFLSKKLKTMQEKSLMKEKCLKITSAYISIWQEMAI